MKQVPHQVKYKYQCDVCGYTNSNLGILMAHKNTRHIRRNNAFKCERCKGTFLTAAALESHKKFCSLQTYRHDRYEDKFKCNFCPYAAVYSGEMQEHIQKTHWNKGEQLPLAKLNHSSPTAPQLESAAHKQHKCKTCGHLFPTQRGLDIHKNRLHFNEKKSFLA